MLDFESRSPSGTDCSLWSSGPTVQQPECVAWCPLFRNAALRTRKFYPPSSLRGAARWCHNPVVESSVNLGSLSWSLGDRGAEISSFANCQLSFHCRQVRVGGRTLFLFGNFEVFSPPASPLTSF